jgi:hypothetical protein
MTKTIATRTQYLALFPTAAAALDHEQACLSIGVHRPPCADLVLAGAEPTPDYWAWLARQIEAE